MVGVQRRRGGTVIKSFSGKYFFLSNFYHCPVPVTLADGTAKLAPTAEHAYQMEKLRGARDQEYLLQAPTPGAAKAIGHQSMRSDWLAVKDDVMLMVILSKFTYNDDLLELLLDTGDRVLVEGNDYGDTYWGVDRAAGTGLNKLGRILMLVRHGIVMGKTYKIKDLTPTNGKWW
jgi:ribA/ribD-fused uncharacterized protein